MDSLTKECTDLANQLILRCHLPLPRLIRPENIGSRLFLLVLEKQRGKPLPGAIPFPKSYYDEVHNIKCILDALSVFKLDLSHISAERIAAGVLVDCYYVLCILQVILEDRQSAVWEQGSDDFRQASEHQGQDERPLLRNDHMPRSWTSALSESETETDYMALRSPSGNEDCSSLTDVAAVCSRTSVISLQNVSHGPPEDSFAKQSTINVGDPSARNVTLDTLKRDSNVHKLITTEVNLMKDPVGGNGSKKQGPLVDVRSGRDKCGCAEVYIDTRMKQDHAASPGFSSPSPVLPPVCQENMFNFAEVGTLNKVAVEGTISEERRDGSCQRAWVKKNQREAEGFRSDLDKGRNNPTREKENACHNSDPKGEISSESGAVSKSSISLHLSTTQPDDPPLQRESTQRLNRKVSKQSKKTRLQDLASVKVKVNIKPGRSQSLIDLRLGEKTVDEISGVDLHINNRNSKASLSASSLIEHGTERSRSVWNNREGNKQWNTNTSLYWQGRPISDTQRPVSSKCKDAKKDVRSKYFYYSSDEQVHLSKGVEQKGSAADCYSTRAVLTELEKLCETVGNYLEQHSHQRESVKQGLAASEHTLETSSTCEPTNAQDSFQDREKKDSLKIKSASYCKSQKHARIVSTFSQKQETVIQPKTTVVLSSHREKPNHSVAASCPLRQKEGLVRNEAAAGVGQQSQDVLFTARVLEPAKQRETLIHPTESVGLTRQREDKFMSDKAAAQTQERRRPEEFQQREQWAQNMTVKQPLQRRRKVQNLTPAQKLSLQKQVKRKCVATAVRGVPTKSLLPRVVLRKSPAKRRVRLRSGNVGPQHEQSESQDPVNEEKDIFNYLVDQFPYVQLSPATLRKMEKQYKQQIKHMTNFLLSSRNKKNSVQNKLEDMVRRQQLLEEIHQREVILESRIQEQRERAVASYRVQGQQRDQRIQRARARRYFNQFQQEHRGRMLGRRTHEEMLLKSVFEKMLRIQHEKLHCLKEEEHEKQHQISQLAYKKLQAMQELYEDRLRSLMNCAAAEKQMAAHNEQCFKQQVEKELREFRVRVENEVRDTLNHIHKDDQDRHFRELDAECLKDNLHKAKWKFQ